MPRLEKAPCAGQYQSPWARLMTRKSLDPPYSITVNPTLPQQLQAQTASALDEEEKWEIVSIIGRRLTRTGDTHKVRWKNTWLHQSDFRSAKRLWRQFEGKDRAQRGCKKDQTGSRRRGFTIISYFCCSQKKHVCS